MKDCRKIDILIWRYPSISESEKAYLDRHIAECQKCKEAFKIAKTIRQSSENDQHILSKINGAAFDAAVMRKVSGQKRSELGPERTHDRYALRMAISYALAATIILFVVKSISDLSYLPTPSMAPKEEAQGDKFSILNLQLKREVASPAHPSGTLEKSKAPEKKGLSVELPADANGAKDYNMPSVEALAPKADSIGLLTIAQAPLISAAPESVKSVNVGELALAIDTVTPNDQMRAARIAEYYATPGSVQVGAAQSSIVVTVEKMPKAVKVVLPEYPVWAKKRGFSCTLMVRARVEIDGMVKDAVVTSCDAHGLGFEESALKAARESLYIPASANGINIAVWIVYPVKFINKD